MHHLRTKDDYREKFYKTFNSVLEDYTPFRPIDIARILNLAPPAICAWQSGVIPDGLNFVKIAKIFGIQGEYLFGLSEPFTDKRTLEWDRQNVPRGEICLL